MIGLCIAELFVLKNVGRSGKLLRNCRKNNYDVTVGELYDCGKFKASMVFCAATNCTHTDTKSKVSTCKFSEDPICAAHFTENSFKQNLSVRRFLGSAFKPRRFDLKEDAVQKISFPEKKIQ